MEQDQHHFNYDSIASTYAEKVDTAPFNALYERPAMLAALPAVTGKRILDAGCGSGWYAEALAARGATVEGVDASASMIDRARDRLATMPPDLRDRVSFNVAPLGERLPFENGQFAGIVSALVLHYLPDWRPALREMHRVLETDGWLLLSTHHPSADALLFDTSDYFATEHVTDHWDWIGDVQFYRRSLTEIFASLRESGFAIDAVVEPHPTQEFLAADPEAYARLLKHPAFLIVKCVRN